MENIAKQMDPSIELLDTKLEIKGNRFLKHIGPDKGKASKDIFVLDLLPIKTTIVKTYHSNVI